MSNVSPQWEVGQTAFTGANSLVALASILSKEDVHEQAVVALEAVGASSIAVDANLIGEGVMALNGDESVRIADMKLLVGLSAGGLVAKLRQSSGCVRAFLLIAALKACSYEETEIADILYQIMVTTGLLNRVPVAAGQLLNLVRVLSGHAELCMHRALKCHSDIVTVISASHVLCEQVCWRKIPEQDLGRLIAGAFGAMQSDDCDYVEMYGYVGLIRLAQILLWLDPDQVGLFVNGRCLMGASNPKIRIQYGVSPYSVSDVKSGWVIKIWKSFEEITSVIEGNTDDGDFIAPYRTANRVPFASTRAFHANPFVTSEMLDRLGGFAAGLLDCILDHGLGHHKYQNREPDVNCRIELRRLWPSSFLEAVKTFSEPWRSYGWSPTRIDETRQMVRTALSNYIAARRGCIDGHSEKTPANPPPAKDTVANECSALRAKFGNIIWYEGISSSKAAGLLLQVECLVASTLLASQQRHLGRMTAFFDSQLPGGWIWSAITPTGLSIPEFAERCLQAAVKTPKEAIEYSRDLIVTSSGRVAFPYVLIDHSTAQEDAVAVAVVPGVVRFRKGTYQRVRETDTVENFSHAFQERIYPVRTAFEHAKAMSNYPQEFSGDLSYHLPYDPSTTKLSYEFTEEGPELWVQTRLSSMPLNRPLFCAFMSIRESALNIALAVHMISEDWYGVHNIKAVIPPDLIHQVHLVECERPLWRRTDIDCRIYVAFLSHDQKQRFYSADPFFCGEPGERRLYIQQYMPLADCIRAIIAAKDPQAKLLTR